jgi:energy-coupling factor transporter ATP-binding protein EcfA2
MVVRMDLGMAGTFWRVLREVSPRGIAHEAEQSFCVLICGQPGVGKSTLRGALNGSRWPSDLTLPYLRVVEGFPTETYGASLCLYVVDASRGLFHDDYQAAAFLESRGVPLVYVYNKMDRVREASSFQEEARRFLGIVANTLAFVEATDAEDVRQNLARAVLRAAPELRLALGRRLPAFRDEAATQVIHETSRVNAEFALLSSLPASVPLLNVGAAGADMAVLTKNQAMMLLKLAAIHERPLDSKLQLFLEISPVVGAAFLWRTAARTAVGLLPGIMAAAPKTLIAFVGTYLVGRAAQHYYRWGRRPSKEALDRYAREARDLARRSLPPIELPPRPNLRALLPPGRQGKANGSGKE